MEEGIQEKHLRDFTDAAHGGVGGYGHALRGPPPPPPKVNGPDVVWGVGALFPLWGGCGVLGFRV